jgi:translation elongation factor EF-Ts
MPECTICGEYTKFEGGLCYTCYKEENGGKATIEKVPPKKEVKKTEAKSNGKPNTWVFNLIKGRIAETIIEELFLSLGFQVYKYGMENTIPGIMDLLKGVKDEVAMEIKRMPDLVVYKDGRAHFIEVKFRASGTFKQQ